MKFFKASIVFLLIALISCNSPMDVDTPRKVKDVIGRVNIYPRVIELSFEENGTPKEYIADGTTNIVVDTNLLVPAIWMQLNLKAIADKSTDFNGMNVEFLEIKADSLLVNSSPFNVGEQPLNKAWTKFVLSRGLSAKFDTTIFSDQEVNVSEISFSFNKEKKEIWSYLYSKVYNDRLWFTYRDTVVQDTVIESYVDTVWINGNMTLKPGKRKIVQDRDSTLETLQRTKDTLFLRGKIRLQY